MILKFPYANPEIEIILKQLNKLNIKWETYNLKAKIPNWNNEIKPIQFQYRNW